MKSKKIVFANNEGHQLAANLELPLDKPLAYALFAHCFTCTKDSLAAFRISKALTESGIAVLRFDFTGLGGSEGDFANTNFTSNVADLLSAANFLRDNYQAPSLLLGHSFGGAAALAVAMQIPELKAITTIAAPSDLNQMKELFTEKLDEINAKGEAEVNLAGRKFNIKSQFFDDLEQHRLIHIVANITKPLLIFHSPQDAIVNIEHANAIFHAATQSTSFISLYGADHLLTKQSDAIYVADLIKAWIPRYMPLSKLEAIQNVTDASAQVIVRETHEGKLTQEIITGKHILKADEPVNFGGNNTGPGPYDLLLAGLGACTSMTIRMYADLKKIPLENVIVKLNHEKIYGKDCQDCDNPQSKMDHIERIIELKGDLTQEQKTKLLEIANKCPVHKTLTSKITITTQLSDA